MAAPTDKSSSDPSSSSSSSSANGNGSSEVDLAQAYRDLARGEKAATALEANLTNLEGKLDALLNAFDTIGDDDPQQRTTSGRDATTPAANGSEKEATENDKSA